ncbi:RhoGAP-domain-containing protein [Hesseltinella vesiculosa]|uniref:RhoGAP-domain-containing protein n=1 Tax=Hesseltinella vesiculosa TaxID=101127 RepID=A0A1X2GP43_9FUNG|nr:RhoGAP-domain-containing protein [Hesseltinella vesiculosa]
MTTEEPIMPSADYQSHPNTPQPVHGEHIIGSLVDLDNGFQFLLDKVKLDMQAAKDVVSFLKKRASIEEEYAKQMVKLSQSMSDTFKSYPRSSSFGNAWTSFLKVHETIGEQRQKFSSDVTEVADDLQLLIKDTEKARKQAKDAGAKQEKVLMDGEATLEKTKQKYDLCSEEWERAVLQKTNDPYHTPKKGLFKSTKSQYQLNRYEEDAHNKAAQADQQYRQQIQLVNQSRREYFSSHLPELLQNLKFVGDECCMALQYQLARYAYIYERALVVDGRALDNDTGFGLRSLAERVDKDQDLMEYIKSCNGQRNSNHIRVIQRGDVPYKEYVMSTAAHQILNPNPVFGVELNTLLKRDKHEVPVVIQKCVQMVEKHGLTCIGIYRESGSSTSIQKLKAEFNRDYKSVDLENNPHATDINNVCGLLKLWFRELPSPVFPNAAYDHFIAAAKIDDERMRILGLHTVINDLPDAHYATLKYLMCHLHKVCGQHEQNKMTSSNLAAIFGMTLIGDAGSRMADTHLHVRVIQTVLDHYRLIFEQD